MTTYLFSLSVAMSIMFLNFLSPLSLALIIISQAVLLVSVTIFEFSVSWFSLIFLMIFISGMMVIFVYVASLASNSVMELSKNYTYFISGVLLTLLISTYLCATNNMNFAVFNTEPVTLVSYSSINTHLIYSVSVTYMTGLMIVYLLVTLLVVVKSATMTAGPLRSFL